jgi:hypothetical protein
MLSHGGSRLNASKPEANPKTSCPKKQNLFLFFCAFQTFVNENPWRFFFRYWLVLEMSPTRFRASEKAEEQKKERARATIWCERKITSNRIAFQPNAAFRWPRWREVHEKFTSFFLFSQAEALRVRSLFSDSLHGEGEETLFGHLIPNKTRPLKETPMPAWSGKGRRKT